MRFEDLTGRRRAPALGAAGILAALSFSWEAFADGRRGAGSAGSEPLECRMILTHTVPSTICRPFASDPSPVRVLFRKMPAWAGNSDLLVVDMCRYSPEGFALQEEQLTVSSDGKLPPEDPRLKPISCARRYCTEKYNSFSIAINALPIPVGWVAVKLWVGFQYEHFRLSCEALPDAPGRYVDFSGEDAT